jgi:two-component system, LytTR family, response regulator
LNMIRSIIIDDEPKNRKILRALLERFCPEVTVEHEAGSAKEAIELITASSPDLVFLDIEMPYGNAFDLLDQLLPVNFEIIFITAFDEYTLKAFKYSALDYLLKPVSIEELKAAVKKASQKIHLKTVNEQLSNLLQNFRGQRSQASRIAIPTNEGFIFISTQDILRFEAKSNYTYIFTTQGQRLVSSKTIKQYDDLLGGVQFFRIHNSHLINLGFVKRYLKGRGGEVEMTDGSVLEVASRRKDAFLSLFGSK